MRCHALTCCKHFGLYDICFVRQGDIGPYLSSEPRSDEPKQGAVIKGPTAFSVAWVCIRVIGCLHFVREMLSIDKRLAGIVSVREFGVQLISSTST